MQIQTVDYTHDAEKNLKMLAEASFLTTLDGEKVNTMMLAWAAIGNLWRLPVMIVAVKKGRFTGSLIEKNREFTVTVPDVLPSQRVQDICGLPYRKEHNKLMEAGLTALRGRKVKTPVIAVPGTQYECRVAFQGRTEQGRSDPALDELWYKKNPDDYHTIFFGEIVDCYTTK